jgi:3-hydroxybutyryl-CoA dehydrogenase
MQVQIYLLSTTYFCKKMQMKIAVLADDDQWEELTKDLDSVNWERVSSLNSNVPQADAYVILSELDTAVFKNISKPILLNSVVYTLNGLNAPSNVLRINGWKGFLLRTQWEVAGIVNSKAVEVFSAMQKQILMVTDEPGLVAARPIAMIINEAYFALEQGVSTKSEIDTAMKLGTNYPFGPFEWAGIIGLYNIYGLLHVLSITDKRYTPSSLLKAETVV